MEVALVYDVAARAAGRPKSANFDEPTDGTEPPKKCHARSSSQYHGVAWSKQSSKWKATIRVGGKVEHLGYFEGTSAGEMEAAYDAAARAARRPNSGGG
jgi:hypothetical protein